MNGENYVPVKIIGTGLDVADWIQLGAVFFAMLAAIASLLTVRQQKKQFLIERREAKKSYWPIFRIQFFDIDFGAQYVFLLKNIGFPYFNAVEARWIGDNHVKVRSMINGEVRTSHTSGTKVTEKNKYESLALRIDFLGANNGDGHFEIDGYVFHNQSITLVSNEIKIENQKIKNHLEIGHTFLKVVDRELKEK